MFLFTLFSIAAVLTILQIHLPVWRRGNASGKAGDAVHRDSRPGILATPVSNSPTDVSREKSSFRETLKNFSPGRIIRETTKPGRESLSLFAGVLALSLVTGGIFLFIRVPIILMGILGVISLFTLYLSIQAIRIRIRQVRTGSAVATEMAGIPVVPGTPAPFGIPELPDPDTFNSPDGRASGETYGGLQNPAAVNPPGDIRTEIVSQYWVTPPHAYIVISRTESSGLIYDVHEPVLTPNEKIVLRELHSRLRDIIVYDDPTHNYQNVLDKEQVFPHIRAFDPKIPQDRLEVVYYYLIRDLSGYGPLDPIMHDPGIEDINCNGENLPVFVFHRVYGSIQTSVVFSSGELNQFVLKLAQKSNKQLSLSHPMVDATLPEGARVQITYSDIVSTKGSSFTIRRFREEPMTPRDLIKMGTYSPEILAFIWLAIEHRRSLIVVGGTASGKTSTMNAVSLFIPLNAKIVSLEDTRELQLPHKNWLPTQTREVNIPGMKSGNIDLFELLRASLRQRPEYIIVGEVRGKEAQTLFQAMNTGHATLSTLHAGSVGEAINRLINDPINVPPMMFTALDLVIVQGIYSFGAQRIRRCLSIHELDIDSKGNITPNPVFTWNIQEDVFEKQTENSKVLDKIAFLRGWSREEIAGELRKREEFLKQAGIADPLDIISLANAIHKETR